MIEEGLKLTSYFGERQRVGEAFLADALADLYERHEIAASVVVRGVEGFGLKHHLRTDHSLTLSEDLPLVSAAVDRPPRIEALLEETRLLDGPGLVSLERVRLLTGEVGREGLPGELRGGAKLTIYLGRREKVFRVPAFVAVCDLLHRRGVAGATAFLGVDGTAHGRRERARFFGRNADVPMMVIAVGTGEQIDGVLPELGALLRRPLINLERVRVCKRDGVALADPQVPHGVDEHGMALWQKLTVYTSEAAEYRGQPVHRAITRRLRSAGMSGATTLRGMWGFYGDHAPHGDRLVQVGRRVPTVTIVIDTPEQIARAYGVVDELTDGSGLVTSETIPAMRSSDGRDHRGGLRLATRHLPRP